MTAYMVLMLGDTSLVRGRKFVAAAAVFSTNMAFAASLGICHLFGYPFFQLVFMGFFVRRPRRLQPCDPHRPAAPSP